MSSLERKEKDMYILSVLELDGEYLPNSSVNIIGINTDQTVLRQIMFDQALITFKEKMDAIDHTNIDCDKDITNDNHIKNILDQIKTNQIQHVIYGEQGEYSLNWDQKDYSISININQEENCNKWDEVRYTISKFPIST